jgi:hypothetical protein
MCCDINGVAFIKMKNILPYLLISVFIKRRKNGSHNSYLVIYATSGIWTLLSHACEICTTRRLEWLEIFLYVGKEEFRCQSSMC